MTGIICIHRGEQIEVSGEVDGPDLRPDLIGHLEMNQRGELGFFRVDGIMHDLSGTLPLDTIFALVLRCRAAQDKEHGGPEHDDTHTPSDWCGFIEKFRNRAEFPKSTEEYEASLIHVASLAIAAIESSQRKRSLSGS